ncbi:hypothetical protein AB0323_07705 [Arthrobacter sp. NPDC080031]|uniref:hypothetical protein n=1 Tax=Arthrobacter sp. NPDC080031 TaxID=3155918 RepID=UPI003450361F
MATHNLHVGDLLSVRTRLPEMMAGKHTILTGRRLEFAWTATGLFGLWIKWFLLIVITVGLFGLWGGTPRHQWKTETFVLPRNGLTRRAGSPLHRFVRNKAR